MFVGSIHGDAWLAEFDPETGKFKEFPRSDEQRSHRPFLSGHYSMRLKGHACVLYREDGALRLWVDGVDLELDEKTTVNLERDRGEHALKITRGGEVIFFLKYEAPVIDPPLELDPTPFIEEENFDFGVFVFNVFNDPERRHGLYTPQFNRANVSR